ncbi:hypothetical protein [Rhizobium sp. C4]|uniref:hypothetical protein n=1 Tax=Rhizobium sp. C4 TaxID=1349800 RepID=UPI001E5798EB|nr:hypothetical protein [Rhizobium sp. C4]MCD2173940.1 hypothetical protein [Rhizobium sp. C4]
MSKYSWFLFYLAVAVVISALSMTPFGFDLSYLLTWTIVGIPIFLLILITPTVTVYLLALTVLERVLWLVRLPWLPLRLALATAVIVGSVWLGMGKLNTALEERAAVLMADDHDLEGPVGPIANLAVVEDAWYPRNAICDGFCQRVLLNRSAGAVIMARVASVAVPPDDSWYGTRFRLEKRSQCPAINIEYNDSQATVKGEQRKFGDKTSLDLLRIEAAKGNCLISEPAKVGDADAVLIYGSAKLGLQPNEAGFSLTADTASANRLSFFTRQSGVLQERYRSTSVRLYRINPIISAAGGRLMNVKLAPQWDRSDKTLDVKPFAKGIDSPTAFAQERLKFDLLLHDSHSQADVRAVIADAINGVKPLPLDGANALFVYFESFAGKKQMSPEDLSLSLRVMAEKRVPLVVNADKAVALIAKTHPEVVSEVAASLLSRLDAASQNGASMTKRAREQEILSAARAIGALPDSAVLPYFDSLAALAGNLEVRRAGADAIEKLSAFGDQAVPTLIGLLDSLVPVLEASKGKSVTEYYEWQEPYLAALIALCRAGPRAGTALPLLKQRMQGEAVAQYRQDNRLLQETLSRLSKQGPDTPAIEAEVSRFLGPCSY